ncbi:MAG: DNA helicase RecG [Desulfuromonas sp.]|nr:MAG: DNA helicase RecG [Desulfuromonas sp.]
MPPGPDSQLDTPLTSIKGVGPRVADKLIRMGLRTVEDALYCLPLRYEDRREIRRIAQLRTDRREVFCGEILAAGQSNTRRTRRKLYEVIISDGSGQVVLKWFHFKPGWMNSRFKPGRRLVVIGEIKRFGSLREVHHPDVEFLKEGQSAEQALSSDPLEFGRLLPVYPLTEGLHQKTARKIFMQVATQYADYAHSSIPEDIIARNGLLPLAEALRQIHLPNNDWQLETLESPHNPARQTLVFDEFFYLELGMALRKKGWEGESGITFKLEHIYTKPLSGLLPYRLTSAQRRVLGEIKQDMLSDSPMNRLIQGDVGSGKTIVALMAALIAIENDYQVAVVAPTEILAEQHYRNFSTWLDELGLKTVQLTGTMSAADKKRAYQQIQHGEIDLVVGTHAVLQAGVEFARLGLGIIDEQHRFGVRQRAVLKEKGTTPDMLVMTATPIPRTLAMTVYGDLALSVIDELPPGRTPVKTDIITEHARARAYSYIRNQIEEGRQAYIVYPLVEESEKSDLLAASEAYTQFNEEIFPDLRLGLLHGRMKSEEKDSTMRAFASGKLQILVATTVIEVGIDVPNATVMMIEHAERFGLSQLHQLRGRVGRGSNESRCILVRDFRCSEDGQKRLEVMAETNDGFRIAEADLEIRGPGEFLGTRQSGLPDFRVANLMRDGRVLEMARREAFDLVSAGDISSDPNYAPLLEVLNKRWDGRLELATVA